MSRPKVSIITTTYNRPEMLRRCLDSVKLQTDPDWEHLIANDGSDDLSVKSILDTAAGADPRIRVFHRAHSGDLPAKNWNDMIDLAEGRYLCFLDDDNEKLPGFVEEMSKILDTMPDVDLVTCGMVVHQDGRSWENRTNMYTDNEVLSDHNTIDGGAFLIRREAMAKAGYFPLSIRTCEDWAIIRRATFCLRFFHLDRRLVTYTIHGQARSTRDVKLGIHRDREMIRNLVWKHPYGVRVVGDGFPSGVAGELSDLLKEIPWVELGDDLTVTTLCRPQASGTTLVLDAQSTEHTEGLWVASALLTHPYGQQISYRPPLDVVKLERIINSVRSCRYGAVIG